jgi:hypothetical protein
MLKSLMFLVAAKRHAFIRATIKAAQWQTAW